MLFLDSLISRLQIVLLGTVPFIGLAGWFMIGSIFLPFPLFFLIYFDLIEAITAAQNESLDQYSAAGGIATEVCLLLHKCSLFPSGLERYSHSLCFECSTTLPLKVSHFDYCNFSILMSDIGGYLLMQ
jgi:hypothetical protein